MVSAVVAVLGLACLSGSLAAQEPKRQDPPAPKAAIASWLAGDANDEALLEKTVQALLVEPGAGLQELGVQLRTTPVTEAARVRGLRTLATHGALEFLRQQATAEMVFVGQYAPLLPLQPFVGELFFGLLLQTPDWYPDTHRVQLVPALRELQVARPEQPIVDGVIALVENTAIEPYDLRLALSCMLWQWGDKQFARAEIERLQQESGDGEVEDRIEVMRKLAELWYTLREYKQAIAVHAGMRAMADKAKVTLTPTDFYAAACSMALSGQVDAGIEALVRCAELQASPVVDKSLKLARKLWEKDPEIASLRADARFAKILAQAFPDGTAGDGKDR